MNLGYNSCKLLITFRDVFSSRSKTQTTNTPTLPPSPLAFRPCLAYISDRIVFLHREKRSPLPNSAAYKHNTRPDRADTVKNHCVRWKDTNGGCYATPLLQNQARAGLPTCP